MPTAVPTMPDSASGLSMTRSSPKSFCRPSVMRKTPPSLPTSSPISRTLSSSSMALRRPMLRPLARVIFWTLLMSVGSFERLEVGGEAVALGGDLVGHLAEDVAELVQRLGVGKRLAALAEVVAQLLGLGVEVVEELLVDEAVAAEVDLEPLDRVLELPVLELVVEAVAGRVVGGRVRAHPVGVGLDERRAVALARPLQRGLRDGVRRQHVVAVDADAREAEAQRTLVERDPGLTLDRLGDGPLVVLAEEHDRGVVGRGEDERLVDVALGRRAVAEVGDHGRVPLGVTGADDAVALHAHRVAGGVQRLGADHDRVEAEVVLVGVPAALVDPAEQAEQAQRVDALAVGDAVLAVGREDVVLGTQGAAGTDLRSLLAEQLRPDAELAVALEGRGLHVDAPGEDHVAVEPAQLLGREVVVELGVVDALTLGRQQLDEVGSTVGLGRSEDVRKVGAEAHRIGQRTLLTIRQRQSRDRRTPTLAHVVAGVCDPDHRMGSTYRPEPASTNLGGAARPGRTTTHAHADGPASTGPWVTCRRRPASMGAGGAGSSCYPVMKAAITGSWPAGRCRAGPRGPRTTPGCGACRAGWSRPST